MKIEMGVLQSRENSKMQHSKAKIFHSFHCNHTSMRDKSNILKTATVTFFLFLSMKVDCFFFPISPKPNISQRQKVLRIPKQYKRQNKDNSISCLFLHGNDVFNNGKANIPCHSMLSYRPSSQYLKIEVDKYNKSALKMSKSDLDSGWSQSVTTKDMDYNPNTTNDVDRNGRSRFGVRSRVRSVLEKAKKRTGIRKNNIPKQQRQPTTQSVVAEAASIGGLGSVLVDDAGTIDVALDFDFVSSKRKINTQLKQSPASTYSPPSVKIEKGPEDRLCSSSYNGNSTVTSGAAASTINKPISMRDAFDGDVSAAFSLPPPPLPFTLPELTPEQKRQVDSGERVQFQSDMKREGSGFVVVDVKAPPDAVWDCLLDFKSYPQTIPTCRSCKMTDTDVSVLKHGVPSTTRATFSLSKFRLRVAAIHKYMPHPQGDYMIFTLDPSCTNLVLKNAKGVWHTQANVDGREGITRVWLLCELKVSNLLPRRIVDYAAKKAMPRATTWLRPQVEAAAELWLRKDFSKGYD